MSIFLQITENYGNQEKAALALGVGSSTFSDWVTGKKIPNKTSVRLLVAAGFSAEEIAKEIAKIIASPAKKSASTNLENNHG